MADTLDSSGQYIPKDLQTTVQPDSVDKNKFNFTVNNLKINSNYVFQFQYEFPDGELSEWSPGYSLFTSNEASPSVPTGTIVPSTNTGSIPVELPTFPSGAKRVDVIVTNGIFGTGKVAYTFLAAGKATIAAPAGTYFVELRSVSTTGLTSTVGTTHTITVSSADILVLPSTTPSTPTASSTLGAIQLSWNGKTSTGADQPSGFVAAKVYVGTSSGFTPVDSGSSGANQVDVLNFANGQNTLNIAVGTVVNGTALTYGVDYYIKIKTTNGNAAEDSAAVLATGSPVRIGQVNNGDIVAITADKIQTGTISTQTITVGSPGGKRVELRGSGNSFEIFGTGGTSLLSYNAAGNKLSVTGEGSFTGAITATSGSFTGDLYASNSQFSVVSGSITALSGRIGNWYIDENAFKSSAVAYPTIELDPVSPKFEIRQSASNSSESGIKVIKIDPISGIRAGTTSNFKFTVDMDGNMSATDAIFTSGQFNGNITSTATITGGTITGSTIQTSASSSAARIVLSNSTPDTITFYSSDSSALTGFIRMDTANQAIGGLTIQPPTKSGWTGTPKISTWAVSNGGFMTLESFIINITADSGTTTISSGTVTISSSVSTTFNNGFTNFSSTLGARNTVGSSVVQTILRNISAGTTAPSGGLVGDVYIQY